MKFFKYLFVLLLAVLISNALSGCTKYVVERDFGDGNTTKVSVSSTRDLEQPEVNYQRGAEGTDNYASFDFKAAGVDNNTDAYLGMFQGMMGMMMGYMEKMIQMQTPPVPTPQE